MQLTPQLAQCHKFAGQYFHTYNNSIIAMKKVNYTIRRRCYLFMLNTLRLPRLLATRLVKGSAMILNPVQFFKRKSKVEARSDEFIKIPQDDGFILFDSEAFPNTKKLVIECREIFERERDSGAIDRKIDKVSKAFLVPVTRTPQELIANPAVREFVLSEAVLSSVIDYFGAVPILSRVELFWSPPNHSNQKSQKYHYDTEDNRQLKIFVNINNVTTESGPFTFISSPLSDKVQKLTGYVGGRRTRLEDDLVVNSMDEQDLLTATGNVGGGIMVDTSRCLHFGSRGNTKERLVLMIQFLNYFAPKTEPADWREASSTFTEELDTTRRLILRC